MRACDLREGDRVDLRGDPFAEAGIIRQAAGLECATVTAPSEWRTPDCVVVYTDLGSFVTRPGTWLKVAA